MSTTQQQDTLRPVPALSDIATPAPTDPARRSPRRSGRVSMVMLVPSAALLLAVVLVPLAYSINLSFRSYSLVIPGKTGQWVGLHNYTRMLRDSDFAHALVVTVVFTVLAVGFETVLGVGLGIFLDRMRRFKRATTSALLLPMILTPLVVGLMFNFALNSQFGYLTWILDHLGLSFSGGVLSKGPTALMALVAIDVWEWLPFIALMTMAGLGALPTAPLEAARIDGASTWQTYRHIVLPMLRPVLAVAVLFRATEAVREFDKVYVLTGGGPGSATTVNDIFQYRVSFAEWDLSYGATLGLVSFVVVLAFSALMFRMVGRQGEV